MTFTSLVEIAKQVIVESKIHYPDREVQLVIEGKEKQVNLDSQLDITFISNLIINAWKYSEGQPAPIMTIIFDKDEVKICVKDHGIGIPKKDQAELFESFSPGF